MNNQEELHNEIKELQAENTRLREVLEELLSFDGGMLQDRCDCDRCEAILAAQAALEATE